MLEAAFAIETLVLMAAIVGVVIVSCAPENRRKLAAWLLSTAQAEDELRRARMAIEVERRIRQQDLESRFLSHSRREQNEGVTLPR